jgi:excinuclease ABC subunit A
VNNLERRYKETDSEWTRQEIEQYMVIKVCPKCKGKRLRAEVLAVKVGGVGIDQISEMPVDKFKDFFTKLQKDLSQADQKVAKQIIKEILDRIQFLEDVGLGYLTLPGNHMSSVGRREQRTDWPHKSGQSSRRFCLFWTTQQHRPARRDPQKLY